MLYKKWSALGDDYAFKILFSGKRFQINTANYSKDSTSTVYQNKKRFNKHIKLINLKKKFEKFFKFFIIYRLKLVINNFLNLFENIGKTKIFFILIRRKIIPTVDSIMTYFFYRLAGVKLKKILKTVLKMLERFVSSKVLSGYKILVSGRFSRRDRATFS